MKKQLLLAFLCLPLIGLAQSNQGPQKNKATDYVMQPIFTHASDLERNLARHNKEFHKGTNAVNIYEVIAGPRYGELHMVSRDDATWADIEKNGALSPEHKMDWEKNISPYLSHEGPLNFYTWNDNSYLPDNPQNGPPADKLEIILVEPTLGAEQDFGKDMLKVKEMFQKNNSTDYYRVANRVFGANNEVLVVVPLMKGFESFEPTTEGSWPVMFKKAFPKEDFNTWIKAFNSRQKSFESFVVVRRADLSSD